jgi:hypothetical protein
VRSVRDQAAKNRPSTKQAGVQSGLLENVSPRGADDVFVTHRSWLLGSEEITMKLSGIVEIGKETPNSGGPGLAALAAQKTTTNTSKTNYFTEAQDALYHYE